MAKNLVIVESPAKAKTIQRYLGDDFLVESSFGHVVDLPKKNMGIDIEDNFKPIYTVTPDKKDVIKKLKSLANNAQTVWLASDEDREGEAIAWHLKNELGIPEDKTKRIVFHEITKNAILKAIENPRAIDYNLVNAQQARRVLDRLVGFELSPVLWRKIKMGLSAGRVQSVAVRLIVEREKAIKNFQTETYYRVVAEFTPNTTDKSFKAELKSKLNTKYEVYECFEALSNANFKISNLVERPAKKSPAPPFTTSTLQQEASRKLGFNVATTMQLAQRLYEAGHITYMRTDSFNLSSEAMDNIKTTVTHEFGESYYHKRIFTTKSKGAQEAHEAIRPTQIPIAFAGEDSRQERLYNLIWKRTLASQMTDASFKRTTITIEDSQAQYPFFAKGEVITFDGFLKLYIESTDEDDTEEQNTLLPPMKKGETVACQRIVARQRFTQSPSRYTEASLVKKLEELGIGRPSTYAPTISTIQKRGYVELSQLEGHSRTYDEIILEAGSVTEKALSELTGADRNKLIPTDIGTIVNDFLVDHFKTVLDYSFTAKVEEEFDKIAEGKENWTETIGYFYEHFHPIIEDVIQNAERTRGERYLGDDPTTGRPVYVKIGRFGPMAQIGSSEDEEKPLFASLRKEMSLADVSLDETLTLFKLPFSLGEYQGKTIEVNEGRYGPYLKYDDAYISLEKGTNPLEIDQEQAVALIIAKQQADAPITTYEDKPVQKGVGRFGPFIKWNNLFINVSKKYDFDHLSHQDVVTLIEDKKKKEVDKFIHNWSEEGISVQKARWGRYHIIKGKLKIELSKDFDVSALTLEGTKKILDEHSKKKRK